jgi:hypothetical protein
LTVRARVVNSALRTKREFGAADLEPAGQSDARTLRLFDLAAYERVTVRCPCGRIVEYVAGYLQRKHRIASDTLLFDLQYRLRCAHCNRTRGFGISVTDARQLGDNRVPKIERVIVEKGN